MLTNLYTAHYYRVSVYVLAFVNRLINNHTAKTNHFFHVSSGPTPNIAHVIRQIMPDH